MSASPVRLEEEFESRLSRRVFLRGSAAAVFVLAFGGSASGGAQKRAVSSIANSFLAIGADNTMTAILAQTEGGQGNSTGVPQVLASELGADWTLVRFEFTSERRPEYINPTLYKGLIITAGSSSIAGFYGTLRTAAASVREMLTSAAAARWAVDPAECHTENSFVIHAPSRRRLAFASVAESAAKLPVPPSPTLRTTDQHSLLGRRLARLDLPAKLDGTALYGLDGTFPDMLFAAVRHGSSRDANVRSFEAEEAKRIPGIKAVLKVPQGIAVLADHYWQAASALALVRETYELSEYDHSSSADVEAILRHGLSRKGVLAKECHGDVTKAMSTAKRIVAGEFTLPLMAHVCMEPVSCTARVEGELCEIWLSTKSPTTDSRFAGEALGIDPLTVIVHNQFQGGDFGRRTGREHVTEAVLLAKEIGRPVKVIWTREEDIRMDQHRTPVLAHARMAIGQDGMPVAYETKVVCVGVWEDLFPWWYAEKKPLDLPLFSLVGSTYGIPNEHGEYVAVRMPVRTGAFRGNNELYNAFVLETMLDEAAHAARQDPLHYRRQLLSKDDRSVAVLDRIEELSSWGHCPPGHFQGISFVHSAESWKCRIAVVVEVSLQRQGIKVEKMFCVCDSGLVVNPTLAEQCLEGGLVFGLSNSMYEEITLRNGAPEQRNYDSYRVLRINEIPEIVVTTISHGETPGSYGEIASTPVGPALGNAVFRATGQRVRSQPFAKHGVQFV